MGSTRTLASMSVEDLDVVKRMYEIVRLHENGPPTSFEQLPKNATLNDARMVLHWWTQCYGEHYAIAERVAGSCYIRCVNSL